MMTSRARAAGDTDPGLYHPAMPMPRDFFNQPPFPLQPFPPELRQPGIYNDGVTHFSREASDLLVVSQFLIVL